MNILAKLYCNIVHRYFEYWTYLGQFLNRDEYYCQACRRRIVSWIEYN